MSRIDELLAELCPNGVKLQRIEEIAVLHRGKGLTKKDVGTGEVPIILYGELYTTYGDYIVQVNSRANAARAATGTLLQFGDIVMPMTSTTKDAAIGKASTIAFREPAFLGSDAIALRHNQDSGFLVHLLNSSRFEAEKMKHRSGTTVTHLSPTGIMSLQIPIPPLQVQREIVRILDQFTELEAELRAELEARRNQYEHYRNELLTFPEEAGRWIPMGEVATIKRGASPRPIQKFLTDEIKGVPWIKIGDVPVGGKYVERTGQYITEEGAAKSRRVLPGDFILSNSMSFGRPYISQIEGCIHDGWLSVSEFGGHYLPDFLYHLLSSAQIQAVFAQSVGTSSVSNLNAESVKAVLIPIVPLSEQERIVEILDKFDAFINDTSVGLPAEIQARRKQYEFYRDKLLSFPGAAA